MAVEVVHRPKLVSIFFSSTPWPGDRSAICNLASTRMPFERKESAMPSPASKGKKSPQNEEEIPWVSLQDVTVSSIPPVLTRDGSYVFIVQDTTVLIVSRLTNRIVARLSDISMPEEQRHLKTITGMMLSLSNPLQLITCSLDGTIKVWDYLESTLHDNMDVGHAIVRMSASAHWKNRLFIAVCKHTNEQAGPSSGNRTKEASSTVYSVQLGRGLPHAHKPQKIVRLGKTRPVSHLVISPDGRWLVSTSQAKLHILDLNDTGAGFTKYATESHITALTFHPHTDLVRFATGERNGKIKIWHCLEQHNRPAPVDSSGWEPVSLTTVLHWHAHAVSALQFTPDGAQLLSGGEEGVLVLWKMHSGTAAGSDGREFVPRLGAPIVSLAVASGYENTEQEYVARLSDGSAVFIASLSLKPTRVFSTIKCDAMHAIVTENMHPTVSPQPLAIDKAAGHLVLLSGHPSTVQFVDMATLSHIHDMEIVPSNRVSRPDEAVLTPTTVRSVVFSAPHRDPIHAEWMATIDGREGGSFTTELSLKLWQWEPRSKTYVLNTRIDHPHEKGVTCVRFSPCLSDDPLNAFLLVTTGVDGQVKTWRMALRSLKGARTEHFWLCRSSFSYRESLPHHVAWAPDGSLLAVAQGLFVTLWDPQTLVMQARLATPELKDVHTCDFCGRKGRYLAAMGSPSRLVIWDLVSQSVVWSVSDTFYAQAVYGDGILALRSTSNGSAMDYVCPTKPGVELTYRIPFYLDGAPINVSRTKALDDICLFGMRRQFSSASLVGIGPTMMSHAARANVSTSLHSVSMNDARATLFDELFGVADAEQERVSEAMESDAQYLQKTMATSDTSSATAAMELFAMPSHLLPAMSTLLDAYVDAILPPSILSKPTGTAESPALLDAEASMTEEVIPPRLDAVDHVAQARDADISHLTAVFDKLMSVNGAPPALSTRLPSSSRGSKSKRRSLRSSS